MSAALAPRVQAAFEQLYCSREIVVLVRGTHYNLDLAQLYVDSFGALPRDGTVRFFVAPGARILSRRVELPACRSGIWNPEASCR